MRGAPDDCYNIIKSNLLDIILFSFFRRTECIKTGCTSLSKEFDMDLFNSQCKIDWVNCNKKRHES